MFSPLIHPISSISIDQFFPFYPANGQLNQSSETGEATGNFLFNFKLCQDMPMACAYVLYFIQMVPYSQAAGPPYCSPPAREYASPPAADRRRDTDRWRRQLTRLPKPFSQYPPLTLRYGMMRLLRCASGAARAGQWPWGPARTFDMIVLTERGCGFTSSPAIPVPQAVHASKAIPQQSLTCILIMSGSLSHCLSRYKGDRAVRERIGAGCC